MKEESDILICKIHVNMTQQAKNSLNLYRGGNPETIKQLLKIQKSSVVNELKEHFNARDLNELAIKLSIGH